MLPKSSRTKADLLKRIEGDIDTYLLDRGESTSLGKMIAGVIATTVVAVGLTVVVVLMGVMLADYKHEHMTWFAFAIIALLAALLIKVEFEWLVQVYGYYSRLWREARK